MGEREEEKRDKKERGGGEIKRYFWEKKEKGREEKHQLHSDTHNPQPCKPLWLDRGELDDLPDQGTLHTRYSTSQCLEDAR